MPFDVAGEHAQKDMGAHPRRQPVVDRAEVQIDGLQAAKGALDMGEVLVGADDPVGRQGMSMMDGVGMILVWSHYLLLMVISCVITHA